MERKNFHISAQKIRRECKEMRCPFCGHLKSRVIDSRDSKKGLSIRRRRECLTCKRRYTTYEKIEEIPYMVVKKDGRRQPFDSQKLLRGLLKACEKRPVPVRKLEEIVEEIETKLQEKSDKKMNAAEIGQFVMGKLKELDKVAYVRFASVYREFRDVLEFKKELENLLRER